MHWLFKLWGVIEFFGHEVNAEENQYLDRYHVDCGPFHLYASGEAGMEVEINFWPFKLAVHDDLWPDVPLAWSFLGKYPRWWKGVLRRIIPTKGNTWWEMQIGPIVLMLKHKESLYPNAKLFKVRHDEHWRY